MKIRTIREHAKNEVEYHFNGKDVPKRYTKIVEQLYVIEQQLSFYHFNSVRFANQLRRELMREIYDSCRYNPPSQRGKG